MGCINFTPFPHLSFESLSPKGQSFTTLVLKATMSIVPGKRLKPKPQQSPLVLAEEHFGGPTTSSVRVESDLAAYKPRSEVLFLDPVAYAPHGRPTRSWEVVVRVGQLEYALRVTGPRVWICGFLGASLSRPEPTLSVPVRYELAFGGTLKQGERVVCHHDNPVGTGITMRGDSRDEITAPQVENPRDPIGSLGKPFSVMGLGPIGRPWLPRRTFAGTFDRAWQEKHWPFLPLDYNYEFENAAPLGLRYQGFFRGDEVVHLEGLHPDGPIEFALPGYRVFMLVRRENGEITPVPARLDTLTIELGAMNAYLTYRAVIQTDPPIRLLEARLLLPEEGAVG